MNVVRSIITRFAFAFTPLVIAACGGNGVESSIAPSAIVSSAGASISGTISGSALSAPLTVGTGTFGMMDAHGVTVSVVGTGISTNADNQGRFTLQNVPTGTVQLNFTGPGSNATVTLTGVGPNDHVQIAVTVNGSSAHVDSEHHNNGEISGRIASIDSAAKTFRAGELTIKVTGATTIRHGSTTLQFTDLKVGDHVEVRGTRDGTTVTATEVKVEHDGEEDNGDDHDENHQAEVSGIVSGSAGTCPAVTFTVASTKVTVNKDTAYPHTSCDVATKNGAKVEVKGAKQTDGSIAATRVEIDD